MTCFCVSKPELTVKLNPEVYYESEKGDRFAARYGGLSDGSLNFAKVTFPDGKVITLPQLMSASGVRYSDDREYTWWEHQGTVRVEKRGPDGSWESKYSELKPVSKP
ncbi:MAG: lysozyme inhibitor [Fibrobacter sp.]|nr:lysozyme inhibitor [Fibrobacter sp.]